MMSDRLGRLTVPALGMCFHYYKTLCRQSQRDQLKQIRDLGFDVVHTEESPVAPGSPPGPLDPMMAWNHIEIGHDRYDWGFLDRFVEDCAAAGLKLFHDIEIVHHLPTWVAERYRDTEVLLPTGEKIGAYRRPLCLGMYEMRCFSLAHPACRDAAAAFMEKVAARYAGSGAVVGYILFEELGLNYPHALTWYGQDVSPAAIAAFRAYLEEVHGTVDRLNAAAGTRFRDFDEAAADRAIFRHHDRPYRLWRDWCECRSRYVARFLRAAHDGVKRGDPGALTVLSSIDVYPSYWIVQGVRTEHLDSVDLIAEKSFEGTQDGYRWMFNWAGVAGTAVGLSNLNIHIPGQDITTADLVRKIHAALGMGTRWNALYAWHWYSHEDPGTGRRVLHENLQGFLPYVRCHHALRSILAGLRRKPAEVAVLKPVVSDVMDFWTRHDPRILRKSHSLCSAGSLNTMHLANMLGGENVPYDLIAPDRLADALASGIYKLLIIGETHLPAETAATVRAWVERGGKLLLGPGAARFDADGHEADPFAGLIRQQNQLSNGYRDFVGWEQDGAFPTDARVLLVERADAGQLPAILEWAGVRRPLEFIDDSTPAPDPALGTARSPVRGNPHTRRIAVYPMLDDRGREAFILVQRGPEGRPLRDVPVAWSGGPVKLYRPPNSEPVGLEARGDRLTLPEWQDAAILVSD